MRLNQLLSNRFVLLLGGSGALLVPVRAGKPGRALAVAADDAGLAALEAALAEKPGLPVTVLLDVADMNFRREGVPQVGLLDRPKVLRRRLDFIFPEVEVRGAQPLPLPPAQPGGGRRELPHLFAAVANSGDWARWRDWLKTLRNPLAGLGLLPLELADMASALRDPVADGDLAEGEEPWTLLVLNHWSGGIRQVVLRGKELVLTRMTPLAMLAAGLGIAGELRATLGYLARLGFSGRAGIQVVGVGPAAWEEALEVSGLPISRSLVLGRVEAASRLGVSLPELAAGCGPDGMDQADALSLAWAARRPRPGLDLLPPAWRRRGQVESGAKVATLALAAGLAGMALLTAQDGLELMGLGAEATALQEELAALGAQRGEKLGALVGSAILPRFADAATRFAAAWGERPRDPSAALDGLLRALPPDIRVDGLDWTAPEDRPARLELRLRLDGRLTPRAALERTEAVATALAKAFPAAKAQVTRPPVPTGLAEPLAGGPKVAAERAEGYPVTLVLEGLP